MCCFLEIYELFWGINHVRQLALDDKYRCENGHTKKNIRGPFHISLQVYEK